MTTPIKAVSKLITLFGVTGMIVELGHFALILAFATSLVQATLPIIGSRRSRFRVLWT